MTAKSGAAQGGKDIRVVLIEWDDAVAGAGWIADHNGQRPDRCISIGAVVAEDAQSVTLAGTWGLDCDGSLQSNNRMTIPRGMIVKQRLLKLRRTR